MTRPTLTRSTGAAVAVLACAGLTGLAAAPAHAATPDRGTVAHFLGAQLAAGGDHFSVSGYPDYGATIDGVLALDLTGSAQAEAGRAASYVTTHASAYNSYGKDVYAGATAKLLLFSEVRGLPSAKYLGQLQALEQKSGQFKDKTSGDDYSNSVGQALGVIALVRAGHPAAAAASFLARQQCGDGGFRMQFGGACTGDPDATSLAVQALSAVGGHQSAIDKAGRFIAGKQQANGGVIEPDAQAAPNTNSTGLAAVAFALTGRTAQAAKAKNFVSRLQFGCSAAPSLRGAIAYDEASYNKQLAAGAKAKSTDKERRATTQAVFALVPTSYLKVHSGGAATAPALACSTPGPTTPPSSTSNPTGSATATDTSTTTGPPIITDGGQDGGSNTGVLVGAGALLGGAALTGFGLRRRMR